MGKYTHDEINGKQLKWISGRGLKVVCPASSPVHSKQKSPKVNATVETKLEVTLLHMLTSKNIIMDL